jgi:2-keto-4-pentenoate hydratase
VDDRVVVALRRQLVRWRAELQAGAERVGWKIGRGIVEGEEHLEPVIGYLTSATRLEPGSVYTGEGAKELRVDAELAVEVGPDGKPVGFGAALELVDVARPPNDFESIVADNVWHRAVSFGPLRQERPVDQLDALVRINGEVRDSVRGVPENPEETVEIASALLAAVDEGVEPGDRIIGGSLVHVPVVSGDDVVVDLGELGHVDLSIS